MCFAGRIPRMAEPRVELIPALGLAPVERRSRLQSWLASKRSSTRRLVDRRAIPPLSITSLPLWNMVQAAAALAIQTMATPWPATAFSTT